MFKILSKYDRFDALREQRRDSYRASSVHVPTGSVSSMRAAWEHGSRDRNLAREQQSREFTIDNVTSGFFDEEFFQGYAENLGMSAQKFREGFVENYLSKHTGEFSKDLILGYFNELLQKASADGAKARQSQAQSDEAFARQLQEQMDAQDNAAASAAALRRAGAQEMDSDTAALIAKLTAGGENSYNIEADQALALKLQQEAEAARVAKIRQDVSDAELASRLALEFAAEAAVPMDPNEKATLALAQLLHDADLGETGADGSDDDGATAC